MAGREDGWFWLDSDSAGEKGDDKFDVTEAGRKKLKEEMDAIFMSEDQQTMGWEVGRFGGKRLPGFSEKQMDFVLHQLKAVKYRPTMVSFMAPVYPADYDSVCVKRMDYAVCATKFKENGYKSYKDFVGDVRLMFSNALKYNTRFRGVHPVSNAICESAESMQVNRGRNERANRLFVSASFCNTHLADDPLSLACSPSSRKSSIRCARRCATTAGSPEQRGATGSGWSST